ARVVLAVAQQNRAWLDLADELKQIITVGVGRQIEVLGFAQAGGLAAGAAEEELFAALGGFKVAARGVRIGVADKEDGLLFIADHAQRQVVRGGVLTHHAGGNDKQASAAQFHFLGLPLFEHNQIQRF